jgi:hypothetical protein
MPTRRQGGRRSRRRAANDCRSGKHRFGSGQALAGGIMRQICTACGTVSIDLTSADGVEPGVLFSATDRDDHPR